MDKKIITGVVLAAAIGAGIYYFSSGTTPAGDGKDVSFVTVDRQFHGGYEERANFTINTASEWNDLWDQVASRQIPKPPVPDVDFTSEMLIAVFMGTKNSGGYHIEITKITETDDAVTVFVYETSPGPNCPVTLALSQPYHIVKIAKTGKQIDFSAHQEVTNCNLPEQE